MIMKVLQIVIVQSVVFQLIGAVTNNVCRKAKDYDRRLINSNCWYNPDADLEVPDIITRYKYPLEVHKVITNDGYILQLFRIPHGLKNKNKNRKRQPIFLQHGIFSSSAPWVLNGINGSFGFILADMGYDVWLGNSRGSTYGKGHVNLSTNSIQYWNFSYHEMGKYDLPASLDYMYQVTGRNDIIFLGQSMGTNLPYVYASLMPEHANQRLKLIVSLAPTVYLINVRAAIAKILSDYWPALKELGKYFRIGELLPKSSILKNYLHQLCFNTQLTFIICSTIVFSSFGFDFDQLPPAVLPLILSHYPAGASFNTLLHLSQNAENGKFTQFDHGTELNWKYYNSSLPPEYNLSKITIPSYVMYGGNDWVGTEHGAKLLYDNLPVKIGLQRLKDDKYNHIDVFFGRDVVDVVINDMLKILNKYKI